jgi:hypothetical protein
MEPLKLVEKKVHYSPSQINMFLRCSAQWKYRYVDRIIAPPSSSLVQGKSYHKALETNYEQKIETHEDLKVSDVKEAYAADFDENICGVEWNEDEVKEGIDNVRGALKDEGVGLVEVYQKELAPKIQPKEVEAEIKIEFANVAYEVIGRCDLIDDKDEIHDHKTTARTPSKDHESGEFILAAHDLIQGAIYSIARKTSAISFDYAVKNKTPKVVQVPVKVTQDDKQFVLNLMGRLDHAIQSKAFIPNRDSFMCGRRSCGYWQQCERDYGGRVKK